MGHAAPITRFAVAFSVGVSAGLLGAPWWTAPLLVSLALWAPIEAWVRPTAARPATARSATGPSAPARSATSRSAGQRLGRPLVFVAAAGLLAGVGAGPEAPACQDPGTGARAVVEGRFLTSPRRGSAPFERADSCGIVTVVVRAGGSGGSGGALARAGAPYQIEGSWRAGRLRPWFSASRLTPAAIPSSEGVGARLRWSLVRWRDRLQDRVEVLYGGHAPLVSALVLARREGLDRDVTEAFAVTGVAHLLAISGFHVGVVAGLAMALLRAAGVSRKGASLGAASVAGGYVAFIGFPDAACRAALILGLLSVSRSRGRPSSRWAALAAAALLLLLADPGRLSSPGFQLSFAGAAGLVGWSRELSAAVARGVRRYGLRAPRGLVDASAAGVAATLSTLPIVAWHFERISIVGIPVTLVATPMVSLALPGAIVSLIVDAWSPAAARFLAGGVMLLLDALLGITDRLADLPWASVWTSRSSVLAGMGGVMAAGWVSRHPRIGAAGRRRLTGLYLCLGLVGWPLAASLEGRGSLEIWMIDVGQGDAIALRTPHGRWLLIDAGPPHAGDPAGHPVVRALRGRGVDRLEALVVTHADADHHGGVLAVLDHFDVERVVDPALPVGKRGYLDVTERARALGVPWSAARAGQVLSFDGVQIRTLHPTEEVIRTQLEGPASTIEANAASIVLLVSWRGFSALLTGDAYVDVERAIAEAVGDVDVLKVGHHGSSTSTDSLFLSLIQPEVALVSVGRGNRYGHPAPEVIARLESAGAEIRRTDLEGDVRVIVDRRGAVTVR